MTDHDCSALLAAYVNDSLDPDQVEEVHVLLAEDAAARAEVEQWRAIRAGVSAYCDEQIPETEALLPRVHRSSRPWRRWWVPTAAAVAAVLIVFAVLSVTPQGGAAALASAIEDTISQRTARLAFFGDFVVTVDGAALGIEEGPFRGVFRLEGTADVSFDDRQRAIYELTMVEGPIDPDTVNTSVELIRIGDTVFESTDGGPFEARPRDAEDGSKFGVFVDPDGTLDLLTQSAGEVTDSGEEQRNGETVRKLEFDVAPDAPAARVGDVPLAMHAEVWVSPDDNTIRGYRLTGTGNEPGTGALWEVEFTVELIELGVPIDIQPPIG